MTFCASPGCKNECSRQLTQEIKESALASDTPWISHGYFCHSDWHFDDEH